MIQGGTVTIIIFDAYIIKYIEILQEKKNILTQDVICYQHQPSDQGQYFTKKTFKGPLGGLKMLFLVDV